METENLLSLVEHLEDNIDELEESLDSLLSAAWTATTQKLPLLDKAKLYVLTVYSIESLLFSYLRLNGVNAKGHPVFKELTRVKQYFEKIKKAEEGPTKPRENLSVDKQAAARVIQHALAGNDKYDLERAERAAKERVIAKRKLQNLEQERVAQPEPLAEDSPDESEESGDKAENGEMDEAPTVSTPESRPNTQSSSGNQQGITKKKKRKPSKSQKKRKLKEQNGVGPEPKPKKKRKASRGKDKQS